MVTRGHQEGLRAARLLMVLSSFSPLFFLWGIHGNSLIPDAYFIPFCIVMIVIPNSFLWLRFRTAKKYQEKREIVVGRVEDHRDHLLVYLFATVLPFYPAETTTWRTFGATLVAVAFVIFLFWHLNLHYLNLIFAIMGYRVFTVFPPDDKNPLTGRVAFILISRRVSVASGVRLNVYRLSDTVYIEEEDGRGT